MAGSSFLSMHEDKFCAYHLGASAALSAASGGAVAQSCNVTPGVTLPSVDSLCPPSRSQCCIALRYQTGG